MASSQKAHIVQHVKSEIKFHADVTEVSILITSEHILCSVNQLQRFHAEFKLNSLSNAKAINYQRNKMASISHLTSVIHSLYNQIVMT